MGRREKGKRAQTRENPTAEDKALRYSEDAPCSRNAGSAELSAPVLRREMVENEEGLSLLSPALCQAPKLSMVQGFTRLLMA